MFKTVSCLSSSECDTQAHCFCLLASQWTIAHQDFLFPLNYDAIPLSNIFYISLLLFFHVSGYHKIIAFVKFDISSNSRETVSSY